MSLSPQGRELVDKCNSEVGKQFLTEAAHAYDSQSYRSCVIMTWIAVAFDILDKIASLSEAGQANAVAFTNNLEKIRTSNDPALALALERDLLSTAQTDFHLLEPIEVTQLTELHLERHLCAHPSLAALNHPYQPLPTRALHFMELAATYLLSKPPLQGRVATQSVMDELRSNHFPTTAANAQARLMEGPMQYPNEYLLADVVEISLKDCFLEALSDKEHRARTAALRALTAMHPQRVQSIYSAKVPKIFDRCTDAQLSLVITTLYYIPELAQHLTQPRILKLQKYVQSHEGTDRVAVIGSAGRLPQFEEAIRTNLTRLPPNKLQLLINSPSEAIAISVAVSRLCNSANWDDSNDLCDDFLTPNSRKLSDIETQLVLASYLSNEEIYGSFGGPKLVSSLLKEEIKRTRPFPDYWRTFHRNLQKSPIHGKTSKNIINQLDEQLL